MIRGTVGRGGSGKSISTVARLRRLFVAGRDIVSNTPLIDLRVKTSMTPKGLMVVPVDPVMFGESWASAYLTRFDDLYNLDNCEAFLDELGAWMRADQHKTIPEETRRFLSQDRREGVNVWWTHRTTRVFHEVLDNTAELTRCVRYGPMVIGSTCDPEDKSGKASKQLFMVSPQIYDLYDTMAAVGSAQVKDAFGKTLSAEDRGYKQGKRDVYVGGIERNRSALYYDRVLTTTMGEPLPVKIRLREAQAVCLIRKFGPTVVGVHRAGEAEEVSSAKYRRGPNEHPDLEWSGLKGLGRS